ncbi:MAG: histidine phosphatase family protein [Candidatus Micrarchaeota archaeon]|nr:histidine phosphatase family protein [Candidatus Micrarchaeota archaeon]
MPGSEDTNEELRHHLRGSDLATTLIITRHVHTSFNSRNIVQGARTDSEPSIKGCIQAEMLAFELRKYRIDSIASSPLQRCIATVSPFAKQKGLEISIVKDLKERDYGIFDGKPPELYDRWKEQNNAYNYSYRPPEGESFMDVRERVSRAKDDILERYSGRNVLVCGHKGTNIALMMALFNKPESHYREYAMDNASITVVEVKGGVPKLILFNSTTHLDEEKSIRRRNLV